MRTTSILPGASGVGSVSYTEPAHQPSIPTLHPLNQPTAVRAGTPEDDEYDTTAEPAASVEFIGRRPCL